MKKSHLKFVIVSLVVLLVSGCGGGGGSTPPPEDNPTPIVKDENKTELSTVGDVNLAFNFKDAEAIFVHNKTFKLTDLEGITDIHHPSKLKRI